ncbi:methyltransferase-like protein 25B [Anopheles bellator]|uniref:methyltransferase-like protein 25B n=1 Tax=Anopheles bellator TaxID=139047 RepID=UPI002649086A|nr:methyltransferase-like protein 25B [Anopheles bellator]
MGLFWYSEENLHFDYGYFAQAVDFLHRFKWIFCYSNTQFVRKGVLDQIPPEWISNLACASNDEFNRIPFGYVADSWCASLRSFLAERNRLLIEYDQHDSGVSVSKPRKGIGQKKWYEIESLSSFIGKLITDERTTVVDFGSGLGYLSQHIHEQHRLKVLGIEGSKRLVETSQRRQEELYPASKDAVQFVDHFITEDSLPYIEQQIADRFSTDHPLPMAIVGLHACADLSITAMRHFLHCPSVRKLIIMPCCYHRMKPLADGETFVNVPVSNELRKAMANGKSDIICRPFLRLGCQQTAARWKETTSEDHLQHGRIMFQRGLVDAILESGESVKMLKGKPLVSSGTTVDTIFQRFALQNECDGPTSWTERHRERLTILLRRYPDGDRISEYLECLQTCLQAICENLILLDRMCYLERMSDKHGTRIRRNLIRLRDDGLSPRCFIFYAAKEGGPDERKPPNASFVSSSQVQSVSP